jgi:hypothetical protein
MSAITVMEGTVDDESLIEATIEDLLVLRSSLAQRAAKMQKRLAALDDRIAAWKKRPKIAIDAEIKENNGTRRRRSKKECAEAVAAVFDSAIAENGLTIRQVANAAGLPWGTARNVLRRNTDRYEERDDLWIKIVKKSRTRLSLQGEA